uniref:Uncharacterized protein n=1 Tax=Panagrellus redivivus TaxID=6233 RepID=A0A7E4ZYT1_PANRE
MTPTNKLNAWRMNTTNALRNLQAKAVEAQAGFLSEIEATSLISSIQQHFQRLQNIAGEEQLRIFALPLEEQAAALLHWNNLMVEPLRLKSLLSVIEHSLHHVVEHSSNNSVGSSHSVSHSIATGHSSQSTMVTARSATSSLVTGRSPTPAMSDASYHTVRTDLTQSEISSTRTDVTQPDNSPARSNFEQFRISITNPFHPQYDEFNSSFQQLS